MHLSGGSEERRGDHRFRRGPRFPFWTLGAAAKGVRRIRGVNGPVFERDERVFSLTEPRTPYEVTSGPVKGSLWLLFSPPPSMLPLLDWPADAPGLRRVRVADRALRREVYAAIRSVVTTLAAAHPQRAALAQNGLERVLLLVRPAVEAEARNLSRDPRIAEALRRIHDDPARAWGVAELAKAVSMSASSLAHRFKEEVGVAPVRYAEGRRIERAKEMLLHSNDALARVAERLGYANAFHFSARFRAVTGQSPRAFRERPRG